MNTTEAKAHRRHSTNGTDIFGAFRLSSSIARYRWGRMHASRRYCKYRCIWHQAVSRSRDLSICLYVVRYLSGNLVLNHSISSHFSLGVISRFLFPHFDGRFSENRRLGRGRGEPISFIYSLSPKGTASWGTVSEPSSLPLPPSMQL